MPVYKFRCDREHEFDRLLKIADRNEQQQCPVCEASAVRLITAPRLDTANLAMGESATSSAIDKWQKQRAQKQKIEERTIKEHGSL